MKQGHIGLDSAFDLWLLGHFKLRIFFELGPPVIEQVQIHCNINPFFKTSLTLYVGEFIERAQYI